jgi:GT2 family glycosyltransferase
MISNKQKVCVVTVTYGNRAHLLKQVVERVFACGVSFVVVVDNNSDASSREKVLLLQKKYHEHLHVISLKKNLGSAGGFKTGLKYASNIKNIDFIWTLDDDNVPEKNALSVLLDFWKKQNASKKQNTFGLFSLRYYDTDFLYKSDKELSLPRLEKDILILNSFCYFSFDKLLSMLKGGFRRGKKNNREYYDMVCGAYGGFFCHKSLLKVVGYPNEKLFTYFDDIEFTHRMYKRHKIHLYMIPKSKIIDVDTTLVNTNVKTYFRIFSILENIRFMNERKLYYGYRNRIILEKNFLIQNKFKYFIHRTTFLYLIYPLVRLLYFIRYGDVKAIKLLRQAIRDGEAFKY